MDKILNIVKVVDTHTEGMPTRVVLSGAPKFKGANMNEKRLDFENNHDDFRKLLVNEPRGHGAMSGAILLPPINPIADFGVLYFEVSGCLPMCVHGTIGVATAIIAEKLVKVTYPQTKVVLDTPAGLVDAVVEVSEDLSPLSVTVKNVDSFFIGSGVVEFGLVENTKKNINYKLAYGGNIYAVVECEELGFLLSETPAQKLIDVGLALIREIEKLMVIPQREQIKSFQLRHIILAQYTNTNEFRAATVIKPGWIDRSPCGTGTSAHLVALAHEGNLNIGEKIISKSFIGSEFIGLLEKSEKRDNYTPYISGRAWVMARSEIYLYESDIFPLGFIL